MTPVRIKLSRKKGWRMPPNTVSVARPTKWGNPFTVEKWGSAQATVIAYQAMAERRPNSYGDVTFSELAVYAGKLGIDDDLVAMSGWWIGNHELGELRGKNLSCWCDLDAPCHADVLLELANKET